MDSVLILIFFLSEHLIFQKKMDITERRLINKVIYHLERENVLLSGSGGTGKSYLLKSVTEQLKRENHVVYLTATTGVSALSLTDKSRELYGSTIHSWSGIGLGVDSVDNLFFKIALNNKKTLNRWQRVNILIIDEVSMLGGNTFSKLDSLAKRIRKNDLPFGGIRLLMCGDFLQLPPVKDTWVFDEKCWKELNLYLIILREPKRFDDTIYFEMLSRFRFGTFNKEDELFLEQCFERYIEWKKDKSKDKLQVRPTYLFPRKIDVDSFNIKKLRKLEGPLSIFKAEDYLKMKKRRTVNRETYEKYMNEMVPIELSLKVGAQVMLKVNLDVKEGFVNGSRGVVTGIDDNISVKVLWRNSLETIITKYIWKYEDKKVVYTREQIPLILAWSHSIHKSQGITIDFAVCNIGRQIFTDAQAYVALSRVRNREGLLLNDLDIDVIRANKRALEYTEQIEEEYDEKEEVKINLV